MNENQTPSKSSLASRTEPRSWYWAEMPLWVGALSTAWFFWFGGDRLEVAIGNPIFYAALLGWLFTVILWLSFSVVRHAEALAEKLGEPYGTLILTISVITIEVTMIAAVMLVGKSNPTLARDTMFAVLMIVMNGMIGVTLLVGGWRHQEQGYNLQGANAFLSVVIPLSVLGLVLPRFTSSTPDASASPLLAVYLILMSTGLYVVFLGIQTFRHQDFFRQPEAEAKGSDEDAEASRADEAEHPPSGRSLGYHAVFLVLSMLPIVLLAKKLAVLINHAINVVGAPEALGGILVAVLVLSPEAFSALRAAWHNRLQRTVNLCFGSALATICLTIPAVLVIGFITGSSVQLGLGNEDLILLLLTLVVSIVTFSGTRTNVLQGAVHLILFVTYLVLVFD